jgi:hypothetical protein
LIDISYARARELLNQNPRYFSAEEALSLTEAEFSERQIRDRDTQEEFQLRRRMFSGSPPPLSVQIRGNCPRRLPATDSRQLARD